ncbi:hypothetical protein LguiA_021296 [Lonicera macranthoides]
MCYKEDCFSITLGTCENGLLHSQVTRVLVRESSDRCSWHFSLWIVETPKSDVIMWERGNVYTILVEDLKNDYHPEHNKQKQIIVAFCIVCIST